MSGWPVIFSMMAPTRSPGQRHVRRDIIEGVIVSVAGGVGEKLADGDFIGARKGREKAGDGIVERDLGFIRQ